MKQVIFNQGYRLPEGFGAIDDIYFVNSGWVKLTNAEDETVFMPREAFMYIKAGEVA